MAPVTNALTAVRDTIAPVRREVGPSAKAAVNAAVMCDDVARTVHVARHVGEPQSIAEHHTDALHARYRNVYGQGS